MRKFAILERHLLAFMILLLLVLGVWVYNDPKEYLGTVNYVTFALDFMGLLILIIMGINIVAEKKNNEEGLLFELIIFVDYVAMAMDIICWMVNHRAAYAFLNYFANTIYYMCGPIGAAVFWRYIVASENIKGKYIKLTSYIIGIISLFNSLIVLTNPITKFVFDVDKNGDYSRNGGFITSIICSVVILILCMIYIFRLKIRLGTKLTYLTYPTIPVIGMLIQTYMFGFAVIYPGLLLSIIMMFTVIYLKRGFLLEKQMRELQEQSTRIAISQIQPHFIYNTLTAVSVLCKKDPDMAQEAIEKFTSYLRINLHSVDTITLIPFEKELEHTKTYVWLEKLRFQDKIDVEYNIVADDFSVPVLCIQPLVENAIKHGICKSKNAGKVIIESHKYMDYAEIIVSDNGRGFDTHIFESMSEEEAMKHVGLRNVKKRIETMCNGQLEITSDPGIGTVCKLIIPLS